MTSTGRLPNTHHSIASTGSTAIPTTVAASTTAWREVNESKYSSITRTGSIGYIQSRSSLGSIRRWRQRQGRGSRGAIRSASQRQHANYSIATIPLNHCTLPPKCKVMKGRSEAQNPERQWGAKSARNPDCGNARQIALDSGCMTK